MGFIEHSMSWLQDLPPAGVLALMFFVAYIENVFPPSPSDMVLVFVGTLIGVGTVDYTTSLIFATAGSTLGFMTAYVLGRYFKEKVVGGRISRYLPLGAINHVERMFQKYGYGVIVANRFLAGTRAIVSFVAGMSKMNLPVTTALSAVSAAVWNAGLLYLGMVFGKNWQRVGEYLSIYSTVVTVIVIAVLAYFTWRYWKNRRSQPSTEINH